MKYAIWGYDVWGNDQNGFTVNDRFNENIVVEIEEGASDVQVVTALQAIPYLNMAQEADWFNLDGDENTIYIETAKGFPLCELIRIEGGEEGEG